MTRTGRGRPRPDRPRRLAFDLLRAVDERDAYANLLMPTLMRDAGLADRDAGFATELGYGTLRMQGQHDFVLAQVVDRPLAQIDPPVLSLLRLGVHQIHHMRVPVHAAVGETVELARAVVGESRASLVNAVLRKVASRSLDEWLVTAPAADRFSHPQWIVDAFTAALPDADQIDDLLTADNLPPRVTLAVRDPDVRERIIQGGGEPSARSPFAVVWHGALNLPELGGPLLGVQDEGSQLVTLALVDVPVRSDHRWLDMCAGPGGKAALLSAIAAERDHTIRVLANEISAHRADLVAAQVRPNTEVVVGDALDLSGEFDRILLDAPCSGIGALRRRPEARWRRSVRDVAALRPLQADLLRHGLSLLAEGGVLAYVTCSPHVAETVQIIRQVLSDRTDIEIEAPPAVVAEIPDLTRGQFVQFWPHLHGTDGMFLALLRRVSR